MKNRIIVLLLIAIVVLFFKNNKQCLSEKYIQDQYNYIYGQCINQDIAVDNCEKFAYNATYRLHEQNFKNGCK